MLKVFGKKKKDFPGLPIMYYEGLPGFDQNFPLYLKKAEEGLMFFKPNSTVTATLPYGKLLNFEIMPERDYMLKYHNEAVSTSKAKFEKWYIVINYLGEPEPKRIALWSVPDQKFNAIKAELKLAFEQSSSQSYTL